MIDKKKKERKILEIIYGNPLFKILDGEHEQPDFRLKNLESKEVIGVEITELYRNNSTATFINNPKYIYDILQGKFWNKGDSKYLESGPFSIKSLDGKEKYTFDGVLYNHSSDKEFRDRLKERIHIKNKKLEKYDSNLQYINLIIYDIDGKIESLTESTFVNDILDKELEKIILNSQFNEIFVISKSDKSIITFPLKALLIRQNIVKIIVYLIQKNVNSSLLKIAYTFFRLLGVNYVKAYYNRVNKLNAIAFIDYILYFDNNLSLVHKYVDKDNLELIDINFMELHTEVDFQEMELKMDKYELGGGGTPIIL